MALHGNRSVLNKSPGRFINGGVAIMRSSFNKHGMQRNAFEQFSPKAATPYGHLSPSAWVLPKTAGGMSSFNAAQLALAASGAAVGGITTTGESSLTIAFNTPDAQLISSGEGSASVTISTNNPLLTASIGGTGSTTITISTNVPILGAEASLQGAASITVTVANATAFPLNDASPLRDASATFTVSGSLTPYAIGHMVGSTMDNSVLTADSITAAVWNAILADFTANGTAGKALASAGSGGVDLEALAQAILAAAQVTPIHANAKLINDAVVIGDGLAGNDWRGVGVPPTVV